MSAPDLESYKVLARALAEQCEVVAGPEAKVRVKGPGR